LTMSGAWRRGLAVCARFSPPCSKRAICSSSSARGSSRDSSPPGRRSGDAMSANNILCYEMNGAPLPERNGHPLRLIAPGWYGVANVKWLKRIEVRDRRFTNLFMGRNYVTIREEDHNGETVWAETTVGRARLKSAPARVTKLGSDYRIVGA